jgi:hypothetical protein
MSSKSIETFFGHLAGRTNPLMSKEYQQGSAERSDEATFKQFETQGNTLLDDLSTPVMSPIYRTNKNIEKQSEALAQLFNARKDEAIKRKSAPGISQTRMS